jgi:chemotaxis protein methyltransferase CheR
MILFWKSYLLSRKNIELRVLMAAKSSTVESELHPLSDAEFLLIQKLVYREAGIWLSEGKKALVSGRLSRRLRQLGLKSFRQYYQSIIDGDAAEYVSLLDNISTNETHFFREPQQFNFLDEVVFPRWLAEGRTGVRPRRARIWCAGCSTGEEPYSVAMALMANSPEFSDWNITITGTDISTRVLEKAKLALWSIQKAGEIPPAFLKRFMLRGVGPRTGQLSVSPEVRSMVSFARLNLNKPPYAAAGPFDLIFCRNVLIYFDHESKQRVVNGLLDRLAPDGYFFAGHSENLTLITDRIRTIRPTIYTTGLSETVTRARIDSVASMTCL